MQRISEKGNENLGQLGYTDHSQKHCMQVAHHAEYGTLLANELLKETDMTLEDRVTIVSAIGNHDESTGSPEDVISAALIIADKTEHSIKNLKAGEKSALRFFAFHSGVPQ